MHTSFDTWWNDHYFITDHPNNPAYKKLHSIYKQLHQAKADLDYIEGLGRLLVTADDDIKFGIEGTSGEIPQRDRSLVHPSGLSKYIRDKIAQAEKEFGIAFDENDRKELEKEIKIQAKELLRKSGEAHEDDFKDTSRSVFKKSSIGGILFEYADKPLLLYTTGRRSDDIGSFFLLAVSAHLRKKGGRPRYLLAATLLSAIRNYQELLPGRKARLDAMVRVDKMKQSHPDWMKHLKALSNSYSEFKKRHNHPVGPKINLIVFRDFMRSLADRLSARSQISLSECLSLLNSLKREHVPDAPDTSLSDLLSLIPPFAKDK